MRKLKSSQIEATPTPQEKSWGQQFNTLFILICMATY